MLHAYAAADTFIHAGLAIDPNTTAYIEFGAWAGKGDMALSIDKNGDNTTECSQPEPNQQK